MDDFFENDTPYLLTIYVSQADQDSFCDNESHDFLQMPQFLSILDNIDHVTNVKKLMFRQTTILCR